METHYNDLIKLQTMGQHFEWLVENNIMHEGILCELNLLAEFIEGFKQINCDEPSLEQLPKVILKVENRINRLKRLSELKASKLVLKHEAKRLDVTLKHLDLFFKGERLKIKEAENV